MKLLIKTDMFTGNPKYGQFMERWGDGKPGNGHIPDWTPTYYNPDDVPVPYYLQVFALLFFNFSGLRT